MGYDGRQNDRGLDKLEMISMSTSQFIPIFHERRILLGVTGSIAAYKAADLASRLTQAGAQVDVILSEAAQRFVSPLTFQSVTGRRAYSDADLWSDEAHILHVGLSVGADLFVIAPITANTIAKLAHGQADSLLTIMALAVQCPLLIAPAMDAHMFSHPPTQSNVGVLKERGVIVVGPVEGRMASGLTGLGRLMEIPELMGRIRWELARHGPLAGKKVVVTAGGTQEAIDPVRVITNRSSGKQGFALAQAALDRGAEVILISAPSSLETPVGVMHIDVRSAAEMRDAVMRAAGEADALLMAAAVADFRPKKAATAKIKRHKGVPSLGLEPTDDILSLVAVEKAKSGKPQIVVGFAAESEDLVANARAKLEQKGLALIVANDITAKHAGFEADTNQVTLLDTKGGIQELPLMSKAEVAEAVLQRVVNLFGTPE